MSQENTPLRLPDYDDFLESIAPLNLNFTPSYLHGLMCAYLCAGEGSQGEAYFRALSNNKTGMATRSAMLSLFSVYSISQQHIAHFDFEFSLLMPDDSYLLEDRALAFSQWCEGFLQGLEAAGIGPEHCFEEEAQEVLGHLSEFAKLDVGSLEVDDEDENALMEVYEYTRMAVLRLHCELASKEESMELLN